MSTLLADGIAEIRATGTLGPAPRSFHRRAAGARRRRRADGERRSGPRRPLRRFRQRRRRGRRPRRRSGTHGLHEDLARRVAGRARPHPPSHGLAAARRADRFALVECLDRAASGSPRRRAMCAASSAPSNIMPGPPTTRRRPPAPRQGLYRLHARRAAGVAAQIIPWNYPLSTAARGIARRSPPLHDRRQARRADAVHAHMLAELGHRAGLPAGVLNVVTGTGARTGAPLVAHPASTTSPSRAPSRPASGDARAAENVPVWSSSSAASRPSWCSRMPISTPPWTG